MLEYVPMKRLVKFLTLFLCIFLASPVMAGVPKKAVEVDQAERLRLEAQRAAEQEAYEAEAAAQAEEEERLKAEKEAEEARLKAEAEAKKKLEKNIAKAAQLREKEIDDSFKLVQERIAKQFQEENTAHGHRHNRLEGHGEKYPNSEDPENKGGFFSRLFGRG